MPRFRPKSSKIGVVKFSTERKANFHCLFKNKIFKTCNASTETTRGKQVEWLDFSYLFISAQSSLFCYDCNSSEDMTCGETLADGHIFSPINCSHIQDPQYCIKMTGIFEGSVTSQHARTNSDGWCRSRCMSYLATFNHNPFPESNQLTY